MSITESLGYSVKSAAAAVPCSRAEIYRLLQAGKLEARKSGRRTIIMAESLKQFIANLPVATFRPPRTAAA